MIKTKNLRKEFGKLVAVDNLNLEIEAGDIFGFIGPNGAGKTTTIRMLATLLRPTAGKAYIDGIEVTANHRQVRPLIGFMPDFFGVYDDVKVWEYLDFFAAAYRIPKRERSDKIDNVLHLTNLGTKKDSFVEELSRGMKQRLCLAKTLIHGPKVLLLDEPASGLDPRARIEIKELLKKLKSMGKTILVSSHILPELADFCNKIGIIEKGRLIVAGDVKTILEQTVGGRILEIKVMDEAPKALEILSDLSSIKEAQAVDGMLRAQFSGTLEDQCSVLRALVDGDVKVLSFSEQATDLEDIFMKVTKGIVS
ncbi:MAG TPA: ABC transporter ATP-binding protein [Armatimonadota bacterium]|nr:ABC transporter ATP-binding protein [Armatimonadota bacterium]